jgi:alkanesulfonate monooxygenase SsuD/methylene tetrahydromethanopterin reductase-like flavin-dependent oxidoreductase (luciferase family)
VTAPLKFGAFVPQGWKLEYTGVGAADAWARSVELAQEIEALGYDHLWVYDHVETVPRREPTHVFEAFTMLAALSQRTERIQLGQLVTCAAYRNAGLLAKEAAGIDVMSGGRLILGLGGGWYEREYQAYGYPYPGDAERLAILGRRPRWCGGSGPRRPSPTRVATSASTAPTATRSRSSSCPRSGSAAGVRR